MPSVAYLRERLAHARAVGDRGLERAVFADLARIGATDSPSFETTKVELPERAVLPPRRARASRRPDPAA